MAMCTQVIMLLMASQLIGSDASASLSAIDGVEEGVDDPHVGVDGGLGSSSIEVGSKGVLPGTIQISRKRSARAEKIRQHRQQAVSTDEGAEEGFSTLEEANATNGTNQSNATQLTGWAPDHNVLAQAAFNKTCSSMSTTECQHPIVRAICSDSCPTNSTCETVWPGAPSYCTYDLPNWGSGWPCKPIQGKFGYDKIGTEECNSGLPCRTLGTALDDWTMCRFDFTDDGKNTTGGMYGDAPDPQGVVYDKWFYIECARFCAKSCTDGGKGRPGMCEE